MEQMKGERVERPSPLGWTYAEEGGKGKVGSLDNPYKDLFKEPDEEVTPSRTSSGDVRIGKLPVLTWIPGLKKKGGTTTKKAERVTRGRTPCRTESGDRLNDGEIIALEMAELKKAASRGRSKTSAEGQDITQEDQRSRSRAVPTRKSSRSPKERLGIWGL